MVYRMDDARSVQRGAPSGAAVANSKRVRHSEHANQVTHAEIKLPMPIILPDRSTEFIGAANPGITGRVLARHDLGRCRGWCAGTG